MDTALKIYCLTKAKQLILKSIYKVEIIDKTKKGIEKLDSIVDDFWNNAKDFINKEKEIDRKYIPNFIENLGEEIVSDVVDELSKEFSVRKLIQRAFDVEKKENPEIF